MAWVSRAGLLGIAGISGCAGIDNMVRVAAGRTRPLGVAVLAAAMAMAAPAIAGSLRTGLETSGAASLAVSSAASSAASSATAGNDAPAEAGTGSHRRAGVSGLDPLTTGSIGADGRLDGSFGGEDMLLPAITPFGAGAQPDARAAPNSLGLPPPDAPLTVEMPAPDAATLIGLRLFDETVAFGPALARSQRAALVRAYEARGFAPFWIETGADTAAADTPTWNPAARALMAVLGEADTHALLPAHYAVPAITADPEAQAAADIALSAAVAAYARDARGARLDRNRIGTLAMPALDLPDADAVLQAVAAAGTRADETLLAYHPRAAQYQALRQKLMELRGQRRAPPSGPPLPVARMPNGPTLKVGMRDERVPLIRARLGLNPVDDEEDARVYDARLAEAVAEFQRERGLPGAGAMNRRTVLALAGVGETAVPLASGADTTRLEAAIRVNMERWRWFPHDFGDRHIQVNIPEQDVKVVENGRTVHRARGIIGRLDTPTPVFSDVMSYVVLNPSWYVPPSIMKSQFLPGLSRDPNYAARRGYEVIRKGNTVSVRQPPGPSNALGRIKFMFPNDLAIYLHDTPNRDLFSNRERALSNGCVRVEDPMKLAEMVVGNGWTAARLNRQVGGRERSLRLETPLPIHLTYFTVAVDGGGRITTMPDVYGYDQRIKTALDALDKKLAAR